MLGPEIIQEARRTHPIVNERGRSRYSETFAEPDAIGTEFRAALPEPPEDTPVLQLGDGGLPILRRHMGAVADLAAMAPAQKEGLVLAANEIATNSLRHRGGSETFRWWTEGGSVVSEVRDAGVITDLLAGRRRPLVSDVGGRGLCWPTGCAIWCRYAASTMATWCVSTWGSRPSGAGFGEPIPAPRHRSEGPAPAARSCQAGSRG